MAYLPTRARTGTVYVYAQNIVRLCEKYNSREDPPALKSLTRRATRQILQPTHDEKCVAHVPISVPKIPLDDDIVTVLTLLPLPTTTPQPKIFTPSVRI